MSGAAPPRRVERKPGEGMQTDKGYVPVYTTAVVEQPWLDYNADDHATWGTLYARQRELLAGRACDEFLQAQDAMGMDARAIPRFDQLNEVLGASTGWTLVGVEGLLPELDFFDHLANRRFPVTWWIRRPDQIDYIAEPDLFHDLFGHVPLLLNPVFDEDDQGNPVKTGLVDFDIDKNRYGKCGSIRMVADLGRQMFEEM